MSQVELYRSVLLKLGRLSSKELAALNDYLTALETTKETKASGIGHLAGEWENWEDRDFEEFLQITQQTRQDLLTPRQINL